jgi:futalosine hydrolase
VSPKGERLPRPGVAGLAGEAASPAILVVAATEQELAATGAPHTFCCGIGPAEAGIRTAAALADGRPDAVLHVGIAGAPELEPLSVVIGTEAFYSDIVDPNSLRPKVERAYPAAELVEAARRALPDAQLMPIATCARVGGGGACEVEAMEGFSVLRAAELAGVPAVEVRTISNRPSESDRSLWRIEDALARLGEVVPPLLEELELCVR